MSLVWPSVSDVERIDAAELPAALVHLSALAATIASRMVPQARAVSLASAPSPDNLLDADAVAARLRVPKAYVYELCRRGKLPHHRLGKKYVRISEDALKCFLAHDGDARRTRDAKAG
jgi:excisionase family DNA binding protein